ncbi:MULTISPECIES: cell wall hydrolase [Pseudomonas]|uniref:Cell wall hydrolase n=1 Tax=Pseudomonas sessilinigenes TaxID=658629 RepID=A0ABX8MXX2_9PSED|nr:MULTISPECIES: cell wall hydrolase [Pseudomonas]AZC23970.1 Cell wall hydrolase [Pseudomonas sessilinigenes]QIH08839.1 cell wall hydrolase [Pseudomonas sp. BIOMIG1BAC]QXH42941.1 cell wall hydrolase [Pseudomonas sessilinigenes]
MHLIARIICFCLLPLTVSAWAAESPAVQAAAEDKAQALEQKAADKQSPKTAPEAAPLSKSEAQAVDPAGQAPLDDALTCLSRTLYWEAKGGETEDMEAVADVVLNRLGHEGFPGTVCEVVKQGSQKSPCQFSWWCDGRPDQVEEEQRYSVAKEIARKALNQQLKDRTGGALYFHDRSASPDWARTYIKTVEIGSFLFYRPKDVAAR